MRSPFVEIRRLTLERKVSALHGISLRERREWNFLTWKETIQTKIGIFHLFQTSWIFLLKISPIFFLSFRKRYESLLLMMSVINQRLGIHLEHGRLHFPKSCSEPSRRKTWTHTSLYWDECQCYWDMVGTQTSLPCYICEWSPKSHLFFLLSPSYLPNLTKNAE